MQKDYILKTYAGWLGKVIGIRLGAPIEHWDKDTIRNMCGSVTDYLVDYNDFAADDDSNGPLFMVRAYDNYDHVEALQMGYTILNYVCEEHGFFWWGKELSSEHTAYNNLKNGIQAPKSGSIEINGKEIAEQIGGQIFIDGFGFLSPNNPQQASEMARKSAQVTHDGEAVHGAAFIAACIAIAYNETDCKEVIKKALGYIPSHSIYCEVIHAMLDIYEEEASWEVAFEQLKTTYWSDTYGGVCHVIPNAGICAIAMLYGNNDFSLTMQIVNECGFDTDCNAGNVGAIIGVMVGIEKIDKKWILPIKDLMIASSSIGSLNISTLSENVLYFVRLAYQLAEKEMPEIWRDLDENTAHFEFPYATHAFRIKANYHNFESLLKQTNEFAYQGGGSLQISVFNSYQDEPMYIYRKTYYQPKDLHDSRYQPSFSPIVYPGDYFSVKIYYEEDYEIEVCGYCYDVLQDKYYYGTPSLLGSSIWNTIEFEIPYLESAVIKEVGLKVVKKSKDKLPFGDQILMYLDSWKRTPNSNYLMDMKALKVEDFSTKLEKQFELIGFTRQAGAFQQTQGGILLKEKDRIISGDYYLKGASYRVKAVIYQDFKLEFSWNLVGANLCYKVRLSKTELCVGIQEDLEFKIVDTKAIDIDKQCTLYIEFQKGVYTIICGSARMEIKGKRFTSGAYAIGCLKGNVLIDSIRVQKSK